MCLSVSAVLFFIANMSIPRVGEWLEQVEYVELDEEEARAVVQKYNKQGRDAGFGNLSHNQRRSGDFRSNRFQRFPPNRRMSQFFFFFNMIFNSFCRK